METKFDKSEPNKFIEGDVTFPLKNATSEENAMQDIISKKIPFIVKWGTVLFLLLLILIGLLSWFIKYPDIVLGKSTLTGTNAPKEVINRIDGRLQNIYIKEGKKVQKNQLLAKMESLADIEAVEEAERQIDTFAILISSGRIDEISCYYPQICNPSQNTRRSFGELQNAYQHYAAAFILLKDYLKDGYYSRKHKMIQKDLQNLKKIRIVLETQKMLATKDADLTNATFKANEKLHDQKVIALFEYRNEESKFINKQLSLWQASASILINDGQQNEKQKEIEELENTIQIQRNNFTQVLNTIKDEIKAWKHTYLLTSPVSGVVVFGTFFQEGQELKANQILFYVQPENSNYFVELLIPQYNFGKVKAGQQVLLKFPAYPFEQYGQLPGIIESITDIPSDSGYLAKVALPNGMVTNLNKKLFFHEGLQAQAQIITTDMRLLERFYYSLISQLSR